MIKKSSFRSKPVGWKGESHRHYLAAKGIKTKNKYFMFKDNKGLLNTTDTAVDFDKELRQRVVNEVSNEVITKLHKEEDENKMNSEWSERFLEFEFKNLANKYLSDKSYTRQEFKDDVSKQLEDYTHIHSGKLKLGW